jgi:hypothetical protein
LNKPLCVLWGASFFIGGLFNKPLCILGGTSFFIGGLLNEPMKEGSYGMPLFMVPIFCVKRLSNLQLSLLAVSTML